MINLSTQNKRDVTSNILTDRLSNLPDSIIHHILSFLDTKFGVQTSVLSRSWKHVWKHIHTLNLHAESFPNTSSFVKFVDKALLLRYELNLCKVRFIVDNAYASRWNKMTLEERACEVIRYALSNHTRHLVVVNPDINWKFSELFILDMTCNLETLELRRITLDERFGSSAAGFPVLATLNLSECSISFSSVEEGFDPFSKFPCLKHLTFNNSFIQGNYSHQCKIFRVSGLQLLSLKLGLYGVYKVEISTPKLELSTLRIVGRPMAFPELTLPSLEHAEIRINCDFFEFLT